MKPCHAHQAAMSPPMAPAPMTWTRRPFHLPSARPLSFSRRKNTRTRFCAVSVTSSRANDAISAFCMASTIAAVFVPQIDQRVGRRIMRLRRLLRGLAAHARGASRRARRLAVEQPAEHALLGRSSARRRPRPSPRRARGAPASPHRPGRATCARRARSVRPVSIMVIACSGLIRRGSRTVPPRPGCRPSSTSGKPKLASSIAMR